MFVLDSRCSSRVCSDLSQTIHRFSCRFAASHERFGQASLGPLSAAAKGLVTTLNPQSPSKKQPLPFGRFASSFGKGPLCPCLIIAEWLEPPETFPSDSPSLVGNLHPACGKAHCSSALLLNVTRNTKCDVYYRHYCVTVSQHVF